MSAVTQMVLAGLAGGARAVIQTVPAEDTSDSITYTFTNAAIGTASSDRIVVVGIASRANAARTISGVTLAGNAMTLGVTANDAAAGADIASLFYLPFSTGTTGTIAVTFSTTMLRCYINVWAIYGAASSTPNATASDTAFTAAALSTTINCPANGVIIGMAEASVTGTSSFTWSNLSERTDITSAESVTVGYSGADAKFSTQQTALAITATNGAASQTAGGLALASWG